jgi:hypothetical protein
MAEDNWTECCMISWEGNELGQNENKAALL